jgi:hypothetical protein
MEGGDQRGQKKMSDNLDFNDTIKVMDNINLQCPANYDIMGYQVLQ